MLSIIKPNWEKIKEICKKGVLPVMPWVIWLAFYYVLLVLSFSLRNGNIFTEFTLVVLDLFIESGIIYAAVLVLFNIFHLNLEQKKKEEVFNIKKFNKYSISFFVIWVALCISLLCYNLDEFYSYVIFIVTPALWIVYLYFCSEIFKKILKKPRTLLIERAIRSVLAAIIAWLLIVSKGKIDFSTYEKATESIYVIFGGSISLIYPVFDMFDYTYIAIDKFEKEQKEKNRKRRIENESNGSKNYTD